nr:hypothetical protein JVH1_8894 [Rhodococcus sp. JVH1]
MRLQDCVCHFRDWADHLDLLVMPYTRRKTLPQSMAPAHIEQGSAVV